MRITLVFIFLLSILAHCAPRHDQENTKKKRPNILLFFVDDMGWQDTSVPFWHKMTHFNKRYQTPNMAKLAAEGMKFTQAYATPVCTPTRVSLMSGMNAARHRVTNWTGRKDAVHGMEKNHKELIIPQWNVNGINPDAKSDYAVHADALPRLLKESGYYTIHVGKAHFGPQGTVAENPKSLGFDINIGGHAAGSPASYEGIENFGNREPEEPRRYNAVPGLDKYYGKDIHLSEALTIEAELAIDESRKTGKPFFLYMAHYAVHTPIKPDKRYYQKYKDLGLTEIEARYASMIEGMDSSLGRLMSYLKINDLEKNTIVLFMSDNGGLSAHTREGGLHTHNLPLSSGKGSAHEGGIREPMIVKWAGAVEPNSLNDNYVIIEDFFPTILEMAGVLDCKTVQQIDGKSFVHLLTDNTPGQTQRRPLFWHYPNEWGPSGPGIGAFSAVRLGDWKLIYYHKSESFELFNIKKDIGETTNLAWDNPDKANELADVLTSYLKGVNAQLPRHKSSGRMVAYPSDLH